jgi:hypothetical protein
MRIVRPPLLVLMVIGTIAGCLVGLSLELFAR